MSLPAVSALARNPVAMRKLVVSSAHKFRDWLSKSPDNLSKARSALSMPKASVNHVLEAIKNNPITTGVLLLQMGSEGWDIVSDISESDPTTSDIIKKTMRSVGASAVEQKASNITLSPENLEKINMLKRVLSAHFFGNVKQFDEFRQALALDNDVIAAYHTLSKQRMI